MVFLLANRQSDYFSTTRTGTIAAPVSAIFPHVNNLQNWEAWSPWAKLDPNSKSAFEGPTEGVSAKMSWVGNNKVGVGSIAITESRPSDFIQFRLEFLKPMQATNSAEFSFMPDGDQTTASWTMSGTNNFMIKVMGLFMNCDKMVGGMLVKGLASLKAVVEASK